MLGRDLKDYYNSLILRSACLFLGRRIEEPGSEYDPLLVGAVEGEVVVDFVQVVVVKQVGPENPASTRNLLISSVR